MADKFAFRTRDIPREKLEESTESIGDHSTVLLYNSEPFASGTFVKCGSRFGILTAYHAIEDFNFSPNSPEELGIVITRDKGAPLIEMQYLTPHSVGVPSDNYGGPDMVFLEILDQNMLGWIKAYRSIGEIPFENGVSMMKKCSTNSDSLWAIAGLPQSMKQEEQQGGSFDILIGLPLQAFFAGIEEEHEADRFDYIELTANYESRDPIPNSFAGVSGAGLWEIPMTITKAGLDTLKLGTPTLSGVQFRQTALKDNSRRLRCHGHKSLNVLFTKVLKDG